MLCNIARIRSGFSDPYVVVRLNGKELFRTKYIRKTLAPTWEHRADVPLWLRSDAVPTLTLEVWDHDDIGRDDKMGRVDLPLAQLIEDAAMTHKPARASQEWWPLGHVATGSIRVTFAVQPADTGGEPTTVTAAAGDDAPQLPGGVAVTLATPSAVTAPDAPPPSAELSIPAAGPPTAPSISPTSDPSRLYSSTPCRPNPR